VCLPCDLGAPTAARTWSRSPTGFASRRCRGFDLLRSWADLLRPLPPPRDDRSGVGSRCRTWGSPTALQEVFPDAREQAVLVSRQLELLPPCRSRAHPRAKAALRGIHNAEDSRAVNVHPADHRLRSGPRSHRTSSPGLQDQTWLGSLRTIGEAHAERCPGRRKSGLSNL